MMRAEIVHVTDHALLRWRERAATRGDANVYEIISAVKQSRVVKKNEPMPFLMPRQQDSVYSFHNGILFILKSVSIDEYHLVTVITSNSYSYRCNFLPEKINRNQSKYEKREKLCTEFHDHRLLIKSLAVTPKSDNERKKIIEAIHEYQELLCDNYDLMAKSYSQKLFCDRSKVIMCVIREFTCLKKRISVALDFFQKHYDLIWKNRKIALEKNIHPAA